MKIFSFEWAATIYNWLEERWATLFLVLHHTLQYGYKTNTLNVTAVMLSQFWGQWFGDKFDRQNWPSISCRNILTEKHGAKLAVKNFTIVSSLFLFESDRSIVRSWFARVTRLIAWWIILYHNIRQIATSRFKWFVSFVLYCKKGAASYDIFAPCSCTFLCLSLNNFLVFIL